MLKRYSTKFSLFLILSDVILVELALLVSVYLRNALPFGKPVVDYSLPGLLFAVYPLLCLAIFIRFKLYTPENSFRIFHELQTVIRVVTISWFVFIGILYLTFRDVSRLQSIYLYALTFLMIAAHRILLRGFFRLTGGRKFDTRNVLVVGTGEAAKQIAESIKRNAWAGLYLTGFLSEDKGMTDDRFCQRPILGDLDEAGHVIDTYAIKEVIVASLIDDHSKSKLIRTLYKYSVNVRIVPNILEDIFLKASVENLDNNPLITLKEPSLSPGQRLVKRVFDLLLSSAMLIVALPLMLIIFILIKLDSEGPVLFSQERVGEGRKKFRMLKFRTMVSGADEKWREVAKHDEKGNLIHKSPDDSRVTHIGRYLRRTSLDELPQLFNVLRGEMSLVGPRPELPRMVDMYEEWQYKRFEVPQGLTGWWQVTRDDKSVMHLYTEDDLYYIRNYSLLLDIKIIFRTVPVLFSGRGAY